MTAPTYEWVCKKCGATNEARRDVCATCGCESSVRPIDVDPSLQKRYPDLEDDSEHFLLTAGGFWMFFPELPIAAFLVLATPLWAIYLMGHGHAAQGVVLIVLVCPLAYGAYWGLRSNNKWATYGAIVGILIVGGMLNSST
jgi:hypothetical protein